MKKALIIALVLGSSSVAMADSFSVRAGASASFQWGMPSVVVRDHRTPTQVVYPTTTRVNPTRVTSYYDQRGGVYGDWQRPRPIPANLDCRNWDPTVERGHACEAYSSGYTYAPEMYGPWTYLGTRESAVPEGQFITVQKAYSQLKVTAEQGRPSITKIAIRFMDGHTQIVPVSRFRSGSMRIYLDGGHREINQIIIYTAANSHGTYSIAAL